MRPSPPPSAAEQRRPPLDAALLDVEAVAKLLSCSTRTVRRMADSGQMPRPVKIASLARWRRVDVERWLADGCPRCDRRTR
jgi:excisionase family DNA binding protein